MKDRDIILNIKTTQNIVGQEPLVMDFVTEGKFYQEDNLTYLSYKESELMGIDGQESVLIVDCDKVIMKKKGKYNTDDMVFIKGHKDVGVYSTDYGDFSVEIFTKKLFKEVEPDKGRVQIEYDLAIKDLSQSENTIEIEYK